MKKYQIGNTFGLKKYFIKSYSLEENPLIISIWFTFINRYYLIHLFGDKIKEEIKSLNEKTTTIATISRQSFLQRSVCVCVCVGGGGGVTTISAIRTSPAVATHSRGITTDLGSGTTRGSGSPTKEAWDTTATKSDSTGCKFSLLTVCFQYNRKLRGWENQVSFK